MGGGAERWGGGGVEWWSRAAHARSYSTTQPLHHSIPPQALLFEREADLHRDLPLLDPARVDSPARFGHLEPPHIPHGLGRPAEGVGHRVLDAFLRRACQLDQLV